MSEAGTRILSRAEVEGLLDRARLRDALEEALRRLSAGEVSAPPRIASIGDDGAVGAMPAWAPGWPVSVKLVSVFPANAERGLPSHQGVVVLFDEVDGRPVAVMDASSITEVRTAAVSAIAGDLLARSDSAVLAVVGTGATARAHLEAFASLRSWREVRVAGRNPAAVATLAASADAVASESIEAAVRGADVVCLCTDAQDPVISADWLAPGAHVSSIGRWWEVDEATVAASSVFVEWGGAVTEPPPAGACEIQGLEAGRFVELGTVLSGRHHGRSDDRELTLFKSTGHAVEDAAAAVVVLEAARRGSLGTMVEI